MEALHDIEHSPQEGPSAESGYITNPRRILNYFRRIHEDGLPLRVAPAGADTRTKKRYTTKIQQVDEKLQCLVLHQPVPGDWRQLISLHSRIHLTCRMEDGIVSFTGTIHPIGESDTMVYCQVAMPERIYRNQLRSHYRVSLTGHDAVMYLPGRNGEYPARLRDLSEEGMFCLCEDPEAGSLNNGEILDPCRLYIPGRLDLKIAAEIRHLHQADNRPAALGMKFHKLQPSQRNKIRRALAEIERFNIRRRIHA